MKNCPLYQIAIIRCTLYYKMADFFGSCCNCWMFVTKIQNFQLFFLNEKNREVTPNQYRPYAHMAMNLTHFEEHTPHFV